MTETAAYPTEIRRLAESRELRLVWSDGHQAEYPYDYVRGYCPCAGCQGHTPSEIRYKPPAAAVEPWRIEPVGNYGISIQWSDGHATGIYRFDFLRQICPCAPCSEARESSKKRDEAPLAPGVKQHNATENGDE
ncbi:MAG: DUF971 domain-containing protein [Acidobacteria bacterium]|nr:DUF971 domain-containing protein [Acidobacteriota bacterium]